MRSIHDQTILLCSSYLVPPSPASLSSHSWLLPSSLRQWWVTIPMLPSCLPLPNSLSSYSCSRWSTQGRWTPPAHRWGAELQSIEWTHLGLQFFLCVSLLARAIYKWLLKQSSFLLCSLIVLTQCLVLGGHFRVLTEGPNGTESSMILPLASSCRCMHASQYSSWPSHHCILPKKNYF